MWRGSSIYFSMKIRSSAKLDLASPAAARKPSRVSSSRGGDAHPLAAAAGRRLDHDRIADVAGDPDRGLGIGHDVEVPGHGRDPGGMGEPFRFDLVAHRRDRLRPGPDKHDPRFGERRRERRRFRTETRSRDAPPRRRSRGTPRRSGRSADSSQRTAPDRSGPPRRPCAHAAPRHRHRNRPRPWRSPSAAPCGSPGTRSPRDWRSGSC